MNRQAMFAAEFTLAEDIYYLNHAAVSPWPQRTVKAVTAFADENGLLGSRHYPRWMETEQALRVQLQKLLNARSTDEIALLKNTSEALSVVAYGIDWAPGDQVIISNQEFPSNRIVWESLIPSGVEVIAVDIGNTDAPEQHIIDHIGSNTRLVSLSSVQYSTGLAMDLAVIGEACRANGSLFCVDAIQSIGVKPFDVQAVHADFAMADGHKWMLGPEGLAVFYCRRELLERLALKQFGWHMVAAMGDYDRQDWRPADSARRFECGSPNMLGIHALHASLGLLLETGLEQVFNLVSGNIKYLIDNLTNNNFIILSEQRPDKRAGIVTFRHPDIDNSALYQHLQSRGVICALRGGGIRFSPHFYTPKTLLDGAVERLLEFQ